MTVLTRRSRIRDLESQLDQLKRNRALMHATTLNEFDDNPERRTSGDYHSIGAPDSCVVSSPPSSTTSPAASEISRAPVKWLNVVDNDLPTQFILDDVVLTYQDALDGFRHFDAYYVRHFHILDPVFSLLQLQHESRLLFWSIICVTAQTHVRLAQSFAQIRAAHAKLYHSSTQEALHSLLDLQAILVVCTWPYPASSKQQDASYIQLGLAINTARQMGLDKCKDEMFMGTRDANNTLSQHSHHSRQLTWLKCFELDIQMSCWHGHLPSLALPHNLRSIMRFCDAASASFTYTAIINIHVELAQSLLALEDSLSTGSKPQSYMIRMFDERLASIKARWSAAWTLDAEIDFLVSKLYIYGLCLAKADEESSVTAPIGMHVELLQACHAVATQLINIMANQSAEMLVPGSSASILSTLHALPGHPKHHSRSMFFAAIVLLKFLDSAELPNPDDIDSARNAFGRAYQMFSRSIDNSDAASTLEVCGRAIGNGQGHLKPYVTTRLAASLIFNAIWLAYQVRENEKLSVITSQPPTMDYATAQAHGVYAMQYDPILQQEHAYDIPSVAVTYAELQNTWVQTTQSMATQILPEHAFSFGTWDNSIFDNWALASPTFGTDSELPFDPLAAQLP